MNSDHKIYFSYAWGDEHETGESREKIVNELYQSLLDDHFPVVRDKNDLGYRGFISEFMGEIGKGKLIVVVISQKYVRSPYCMFELYEIARDAKFDKHLFAEKVLPIVVERIDFTNPDAIEEISSYWETEYNKWETLVRKRVGQLAGEQLQRYDRMRMIHQNMGKLMEWIVDMNTPNPTILSANNFAEMKKAIIDKIATMVQPRATETHTNDGSKTVKKFLNSEPFYTDIFLGREDDLQAVHQKLFESNNLLLLVNGKGGIGKTTLAAQYFRRYQDEYQHLAWLFAGNSLSDALLTLNVPLGLRFSENSTIDEKKIELSKELHNLTKPCLLVIDNANELKDLEENYVLLRSISNFHLILTTRITKFEQAATHKIEPLEKGVAFELFKKHYSRHQSTEDDLLERILEAVGYNTLVVELLAKNLNNLNQFKARYSLKQLLQDLQDKGLLALSRDTLVNTNYQSEAPRFRNASIESVVGAMYDLSKLSEKESALLSVFAVLPAENLAFETLGKLLSVLDELEQPLLSLTQKGWLDYNEQMNSFKISPVIQEIAIQKNPELLSQCKDLLDNLIDQLDYEGGTGHFINLSYEEAAIYTRYAESVIDCLAADHTIAVLCERVGNYYKTTGNLDKALEFYQQCSQLEQELSEAHPHNVWFKNNLAISYSKLGETQALLGDLEKASESYQKVAQLAKELYEANSQNVRFKKGLAISYQYLGDILASRDKLDEAMDFYQRFSQLTKELYEAGPQNVDFKNGLSISYQKLGHTQASLGNLDAALAFHKQSYQLGKELYEAYPQNAEFKNNLAVSYSKLGETQASLGNLNEALDFHRQSNQLVKELYEAYPQNVEFKSDLADSYQQLGNTVASLGNLEKALAFHQQSNQLKKELYEAYPQNVEFKNNLALSNQRLGYVNEQNKDYETAINYYQLSQELLLELVNKFPAYILFKKNLLWVENRLKEINL